jgi:predicted nucleic acid-binding protein
LRIGLDSSVLIASVKAVGEKFHAPSLEMSKKLEDSKHEGICSALVLTEIPGALVSTLMPVDKIYETEASVLARFRVGVKTFEEYADDAVDLMLEFRDLKRRFGINSADFHHLATARGEGCKLFVTTDERHLLKKEFVEAFSRYMSVCQPSAALESL